MGSCQRCVRLVSLTVGSKTHKIMLKFKGYKAKVICKMDSAKWSIIHDVSVEYRLWSMCGCAAWSWNHILVVYMGLVWLVGLLFMSRVLAQRSSRIHVLRVAAIGVQKLASHQVQYSHYTTQLVLKSSNEIFFLWEYGRLEIDSQDHKDLCTHRSDIYSDWHVLDWPPKLPNKNGCSFKSKRNQVQACMRPINSETK